VKTFGITTTVWRHSDRGTISAPGADILQNCNHIRTQSADINELYAIRSQERAKFGRGLK